MASVFFVRITCYGCKHEFDAVVNIHQYAIQCPNCPQYASVVPHHGDPVMDKCPACDRAADDHRWIRDNMICKPQGVAQ